MKHLRDLARPPWRKPHQNAFLTGRCVSADPDNQSSFLYGGGGERYEQLLLGRLAGVALLRQFYQSGESIFFFLHFENTKVLHFSQWTTCFVVLL